MRYVDGITKYTPKSHQSRVRRRFRRRWFAILVIPLIVLGIYIQPILAALPLNSWSEGLTASRLLRPGRYLVLFQNPRELRPTGGFLGSFAEVTVGTALQIRNITVETNIYSRNKAHQDVLPTAPEPLRSWLPAGNKWEMQDSNWAIDFPEAAQAVAAFYQLEGGRPVDGVFALDARILERILRLTGPIDLPADDLYLTSDNIIDTLQEEIEKNYWLRDGSAIQNEPKSVLKDLLPVMLSRLKDQSLTDLIALATNALDAKEVQVFVRDPDLGQLFSEKQWDGHLRINDANDFLEINEANLSPVDTRVRVLGAKSSFSIDRQAFLKRNQGGVHHLTLTRTHRGALVWPDGPNASYLRLVLPTGSQLQSATRNQVSITNEIKPSHESGASVVGFWSRLSPGETEVFQIDYITPNPDLNSLLIERQAGLPAYPIEVWDGNTLRFSGLTDHDLSLVPSN